MKSKTIHLDEDQLIWSVVDENDLAPAVRNHLSSCPVCQERKRHFEQELNNLGNMTKAFSPLPREKPVPVVQIFRNWLRPAFVSGFALVLLIMGIWWSSPFPVSQENRMTQAVGEMEDDSQLVVEIRVVEEYALPDLYMDIAGESYGYFGDEFLEFVVPLEENQIRSTGSARPVRLIHLIS
ncbi:hypothetical protein [Desulfonema magnum]|uniref:Zinc-finger domain-containing protein n=1 Tax=Desulfonema magnum TaxID=45655 RepID=A0A975BT74_9BACT|nr:hypothetical protein [Desulfonema magnum]QTA90670.1 Uncharacterized protein dnm_067320 [Desulfonema magnum]